MTGQFATGVTVVTTKDGDETSGMTVNSFASVSLDPPMVLFCANNTSHTGALIAHSKNFAINILGANQQAIAAQFAHPGADKMQGVQSHTATTGAPILDGSLAWLDCQVTQVVPAGDHQIIIGQVDACGTNPDPHDAPLIFQGGYYSPLIHCVRA